MPGITEQSSALLSGGDDRFVDLRIRMTEAGAGGATILDVGGRWDRSAVTWAGDGDSEIVWRLQPAQYEAAWWFRDWFNAHMADERLAGPDGDVYTLLFLGGRGAGKSDLGVRLGAILGTAIQGSWIWFSAPTDERHYELQQYLRTIIPSSWYHERASQGFFHLWNRTDLRLLSGWDPARLKQGRVDYFLVNEGQEFPFAAYKKIRPRLADTSGLGVIAANPPDSEKGDWILRFHERAKAGKLPGVKLFEFDRRKNFYLDQRALEVLRPEFGDDDYAREIDGEMRPFGDRVFYSWSDVTDVGNIRPVPEIGDVTRQWCRRKLKREHEHVVSLDFQMSPYMAAVEARFFASSDPNDPFSWFTNALTSEGAEEELSDALYGAGYHPDTTGLICDASGWWQDAERTKGQGSIDILKRCGWKFFYRPDPLMKKNPLVTERMKVANARMGYTDPETGQVIRRAFSSPELLELNHALKFYKRNPKTGKPVGGKRSHLCDSATYILWHFWPRRKPAKRPRFEYEGGQHERTDFDRSLDGF